MNKSEQLKLNSHRDIKVNIKEIVGGEFFEPKKCFDYFSMRSTDIAIPSKGKYGKTFKVNTTKPL